MLKFNASITCSAAGGSGSIPVWRTPEEGNDNPFQYSCMENPIDSPGGGKRVGQDLKTQQQWMQKKNLLKLTTPEIQTLSKPTIHW